MEIHFSLADGEHMTASVMEDDIEDDDKDDDEVELNFREECAADEALRFCWEGAVEGGGGGDDERDPIAKGLGLSKQVSAQPSKQQSPF